MNNNQFLNKSQPPNLVNACILLYLNAVLSIIFVNASSGIAYLLYLSGILGAVGAFGIANSKRWGYQLAVVTAIIPFVVDLYVTLASGIGWLLNARGVILVIFQVLLVYLLLHPTSRKHQSVWFK